MNHLEGDHRVIFGDGQSQEYLALSTFVDNEGLECVEFIMRPSYEFAQQIDESLINPRDNTIRISIPKIQTIWLVSTMRYSRILCMPTWDGRHTPMSLRFGAIHSKIMSLQKSIYDLEKAIESNRRMSDLLKSEPHRAVNLDTELILEMSRIRSKNNNQNEDESENDIQP